MSPSRATPLTSIIGYLEMILSENFYGRLPEKAKEKLGSVFNFLKIGHN